MNLFTNRNRLTDIENKLMVTKGEMWVEGGGINQELGMNINIILNIRQHSEHHNIMTLIRTAMSLLKYTQQTDHNYPRVVWPTQTSGRNTSHILSTLCLLVQTKTSELLLAVTSTDSYIMLIINKNSKRFLCVFHQAMFHLNSIYLIH